MASSRPPRFQAEVDCLLTTNQVDVYYNQTPGMNYLLRPNQVSADHNPTPNRNSHVQFVLHIRSFLEDDNGSLQEQSGSLKVWYFPRSVFGCDKHRNLVANRLFEAGWPDQATMGDAMDFAFDTYPILEQKEKKDQIGERMVIVFRVKRIEKRNVDNPTTMELSIREDHPKVEDYGNGGGSGGGNCAICMEKLDYSKLDVVTCLPCYHLFHQDCITKWLIIRPRGSSPSCPLCRQKIVGILYSTSFNP